LSILAQQQCIFLTRRQPSDDGQLMVMWYLNSAVVKVTPCLQLRPAAVLSIHLFCIGTRHSTSSAAVADVRRFQCPLRLHDNNTTHDGAHSVSRAKPEKGDRSWLRGVDDDDDDGAPSVHRAINHWRKSLTTSSESYCSHSSLRRPTNTSVGHWQFGIAQCLLLDCIYTLHLRLRGCTMLLFASGKQYSGHTFKDIKYRIDYSVVIRIKCKKNLSVYNTV